MHAERHDLGVEEALDHAEERVELLAALQPHHEVGLQQLHLVVLDQLTVDARHEAAGIDDDEVRALLTGADVQPGERGDERQQVALRRGRPDEPEGVGLRERLGLEVLERAHVLEPDGGRRTDGLLAGVAVEERRGAAGLEGGAQHRLREGRLPGVEAADQEHRAMVPHGALHEHVMLVQSTPSSVVRRLGAP